MEPQIRYRTTSDGVSIACYSMGRGVPLVLVSLPYSNVQAEWRFPGETTTLDAIRSVARLVRYDHRGFGLSDRSVTDRSLAGHLRDLDAVFESEQLPPAVLVVTTGLGSPIAIAYAAQNPGRVSHLVLSLGYARMPRLLDERMRTLLVMDDWRFVSEGISRLAQGWDDDAASHESATLLRESTTLEGLRAAWEEYAQWDTRDLAAQVQQPTLLIHLKDHPLFPPEVGRETAALMPNARAIVLDGRTAAERAQRSRAAITEFLGGSSASTPPSAPPVALSGTAVILFADIVGSTALTERMGDTAFREKARALDIELRRIIAEVGGTTIDAKTLGDGVLATFPAASQGIDAAMRCAAAGDALGLTLHLGLHAGDVIREEGNVFGGAVNIASRISALAAPGEVLVSDIVRGLARTSAGVVFEDRGEHALKGIAEPQRVFAVRGQS